MVTVLNTEKLTYLLENPDAITSEEVVSLEHLSERYPWFQAAKVLHLRALKNAGHFSYNNRLKMAAAHTADRGVLFDFITSEVKKPETLKKLVDEVFEQELKQAGKTLEPDLFERKPTTPNLTEEIEIEVDRPLEFTKEDKFSFNEWLKLTSVKPIERKNETEKSVDPKAEKFSRIEKFIQNQAKLSPDKNYISDKRDLAEPFTQTNEALMTETLAKVYIQQKNYQKAIQAYKILILKYPEKSGFFADQIKAIEKISDKNT